MTSKNTPKELSGIPTASGQGQIAGAYLRRALRRKSGRSAKGIHSAPQGVKSL